MTIFFFRLPETVKRPFPPSGIQHHGIIVVTLTTRRSQHVSLVQSMLAFQTTNMLLFTRVFIRTVHGRVAFDTSPRITGHVYTTAARAQFLFFSLYGRPPPALRVSVKRRVNPAAAAAAGLLAPALLHRPPPLAVTLLSAGGAREPLQGTSPFIFSAAVCLDK